MAAKKTRSGSAAASAPGVPHPNHLYLGTPWTPDPTLKMPDPNVPMPVLDEAGERETTVRRAHGYGYSDYVV
jgi:hypothetical protein